MKKIVILLMLILAILCGCAQTPANESTPSTGGTTESTTPTTKPTQTQPAPTETQPAPTETEPLPTETEPAPTETEPAPTETEPVVLYHNPLTGEPLSEPSNSRPFAIMMNNIKAAMPQHGISKADIVFEVLAEGGITRCMGIFQDISDVDAFGSIRSARKYFVQLAQGFDAIYVHAGGSSEANAYIKANDIEDLDGVGGSGAYKYFYRDQDRLNAGYSLEHTMFIKSDSIYTYAQKLGYTTTRPDGVDFGWQFGESSTASGNSASDITVHFGSGKKSKTTSFGYDSATGLYYASQYGTAHIDGSTDQQVSYRNVLVLMTKVVNQTDGSGLLTIDTVGSGTGYYACDGKIISIQWSRESATSPFVFSTESGEIITLGVGNSYIGIIPTTGVVNYS